MNSRLYRGRLAPSPTGYLHLGHARTFWIAQERARAHGGTLILRNEDLDRNRCRPHFVTAMIEDLKWFGFQWQEGPDCPDAPGFGPYTQSERLPFYRVAFEKLRAAGCIYPCTCSRRDILDALGAPHESDDEPIYPGTCRPPAASSKFQVSSFKSTRPVGTDDSTLAPRPSTRCSWRFQVPDGETISFLDGRHGPQSFVAGKDFGDFIVWRHDPAAAGPAYQLAVVVDDAAMQITEVVRGADLLVSTARQILLYRALGLVPPAFYHCPLLTDENGVRLAKRHDALSLRALRAQSRTPESLRASWTTAFAQAQYPKPSP